MAFTSPSMASMDYWLGSGKMECMAFTSPSMQCWIGSEERDRMAFITPLIQCWFGIGDRNSIGSLIECCVERAILWLSLTPQWNGKCMTSAGFLMEYWKGNE
jgi:hypothetical protein